METTELNRNLTVATVLERWPETVVVFQELKTACVGCAMAPFDTLEDVARIYDMDLSRLLDALQREIKNGARQKAQDGGVAT